MWVVSDVEEQLYSAACIKRWVGGWVGVGRVWVVSDVEERLYSAACSKRWVSGRVGGGHVGCQ